MDIKLIWQKNYKKIAPILILVAIVLIGHFIFPVTEKDTQKAKENIVAPVVEKPIIKKDGD